jgi:hypothetical protein
MFETLLTVITQWNQRTTDRQKLQHTYVALLFVVIFIAGIVSLVNDTRSRQLMYVALALIITVVTNFVIWSLLKTTVLDKLPRQNRAPRTTAARRR